MTPRLRSLLAQVGSFLLAGILLYLALRGVDLAAVGDALRRADYRWLAPLVGVVILSHVLRAWRWQVLLEALPDDAREADVQPVTLRLAFYSLMIGYMVNYAAPRLGEVARTANLATRTKRRFGAVFGTVVVERILDVVVLALALGSVFFILLDRTSVINDLFIAPVTAQLGRIPALGLGLLALGVAALVFFIYRKVVRQTEAQGPTFWRRRVAPVLGSFKDGLMTLRHTRRPWTIVVSTVLMWACYVLMAHLPFVMLGMAAPYEITLLDTWAIMTLGAVGIVIPSPGGVGSYHYITIQTLVHLFAVDAEPAATYAVLSHAAQLVLYVAIGALSLVLQGTGLRALKDPRSA